MARDRRINYRVPVPEERCGNFRHGTRQTHPRLRHSRACALCCGGIVAAGGTCDAWERGDE